MKEEKNNAIQIAQSKASKMSVEQLNEINLKIAEIEKLLTPFKTQGATGIITASKALKSVGQNISEHFYRYEQEETSNE